MAKNRPENSPLPGITVIEITDTKIISALEALFGSVLNSPQIDFGTANYLCFDPVKYIPEGEFLENLPDLEQLMAPKWKSLFKRKKNDLKLEEVVRDILGKETTLDLKDRMPYLFPGPTRAALKYLLDHFSHKGKSIALPLPNWQFWSINGEKSLPHSFAY